MVAMADALDLTPPVGFRAKTLTDPVRLREDWEQFWLNWNGRKQQLPTHSERLLSASASTTDLTVTPTTPAVPPKSQTANRFKIDAREAIATTPTAWSVGQNDSGDDSDSSLVGYSPSLQMAIDINEKPDPVKIKHERHIYRTKTLLAANSFLRQLSESESKRLAEFDMIETVKMRRRRLSDSGVELSLVKTPRNSIDDSPPSLLNIDIGLGKKRVSFCADAHIPPSKSESKIGDYLNVELLINDIPKPILMKRNKSEPCPLNHMDYPTFKAWRRGRRMSLEAVRAATLEEARSSIAEPAECSRWTLMRWFRNRNIFCCNRPYSVRIRPRNDRVAASKIFPTITIMTNETTVDEFST